MREIQTSTLNIRGGEVEVIARRACRDDWPGIVEINCTVPDMPWERFQFLGNTSLKGAYLALLDFKNKNRIAEIANKMTYIELSADNRFFDAFTSAMFLPHTDKTLFPSVHIKGENNKAPV